MKVSFPADIADGINDLNIAFKEGDKSNSDQISNVDSALEAESTLYFKDIKSDESNGITSARLRDLQRIMIAVKDARAETLKHLTGWRKKEERLVKKYLKWNKGWFLKNIFKRQYEQIRNSSKEASLKRKHMQERESEIVINLRIKTMDEVSHRFNEFKEKFKILSQSSRIWDTKSERRVDGKLERSIASHAVIRELVKFKIEATDIFIGENEALKLSNANGGDIYFCKGFVVYLGNKERLSIVEYKDISIKFEETRFAEGDIVPHDSKVIDHTWAKSNKDGSPDRRFANNYEIPIVRYGELRIQSITGINEEYMISNADSAEQFAESYSAFKNSAYP